MGDKWLVRFRGETIPYFPRQHTRSKPAKNQTLPSVWIGFDSEAAKGADGFDEVITYQTHNGEQTRLEYVEPGDGFRHFWSIVIRSIPEELFRPITKRLITVPVYCHNWSYDWGMIVKDGPEGWKSQSKMNLFFEGFSDTVKVERSTWNIRVESGHMDGNAASMSVIVHNRGQGVRLRLLDTIPFFPKALATVAKELGMEKGDRKSVIGVDWRRMSYTDTVTAQTESGETVQVTKRDFEIYARHDPELVWELGKRIRQLHEIEGLTSLAVSGAGYAAKVMLANLDTPFTGGHGGQKAVQIALDAFHGGRSGRLVHGQIEGGSIYDFRSSYPSVQVRLPSLHSDYTLVYRHYGMDIDEFLRMAKRYHGFARVSGYETDSRYPAILSANSKGSIRPIVGRFESAPATVAEIYMGVRFGGITLTRIDEAVFYAPKNGQEESRPFGGFIERAWNRKNSFPKGTLEYDAAKIQANSGYGKLIEHRGGRILVSDSIQIPLHRGGKEGEEEARNFFLGYHPDYWHDALFDWRLASANIAGYTQLENLLKAAPEFGYYATPQYAAWITGHAHARLVLMMRLFEGIKWDTDSVTTLLSEQEVRERIDEFPVDSLPDYIQPLAIGDNLGDLDMEGRNMAGVILGNKRYYLEGEVRKGGKWIPGYKEGHHGLPGIKREDIKTVLTGEAASYTPKARPIKIGSAQTWREVGVFTVGSRHKSEVSPQFLPDPKQDWETGGAYREFGGFGKER